MTPTLGSSLRAAREQLGLSLQDAVHQTRIPLQRLQYLEDDNYAAFGSLTYARSFLRIYSQFLEVDASAMLEKLPQGRLGGPNDYRYLTAGPELWVAKSNPANAQGEHLEISKSPVHAGLVLFVLLLTSAALWGGHIAREKALADKANAISVSMAEHEKAFPDYHDLAAQLAHTDLSGRKSTKAVTVGPQEIEKLLSERAGKRRPAGLE